MTVARIICCDGKCILADTDKGCILNDPVHDGDLKKADKIIALTPVVAREPVGWRDKVFQTIEERLRDLAEASALYGKDQRLDAPAKVDRNNREISWLKDLRSMLRLTSPPPASAVREALEEFDRLSLVIESAVRNESPSQHGHVLALIKRVRALSIKGTETP